MNEQIIFLERTLSGNGKHGINWTEGPARARKEGKAQGQFKSPADLEFVLASAKDIGVGGQQVINLPGDSTSILHQPAGTTIAANRVYIKVYQSGKVHAFPCEDGYLTR